MKNLSDTELLALLEKCVKIKKYKSKISDLKKKLKHYRNTSNNSETINKLEIRLLKTNSRLKLINSN